MSDLVHVDASTGIQRNTKGNNDAVHVIQRELYNTDGTPGKNQAVTGDPKHHNDIPNYTLHASQGVVAEVEIVTTTYTAGMNVTAALINAWAGAATPTFLGVYVTFNAASLTDAATRLQSLESNTSTLRYFVKAGTMRLFKLGVEITRIDMVAIDNDATPDNNVEVEPY
jgi:uncharacterized protein YukE